MKIGRLALISSDDSHFEKRPEKERTETTLTKALLWPKDKTELNANAEN